MNTINQICVFMENKPGKMASILKIFSDSAINLRALNIAETEDYGVLRIICTDTEKAYSLLIENGFIASKAEVLAIEVPDTPGGLEGLLETLSNDGVDIAYMYSVFAFIAGSAYMIIRPKSIEALNACIEKNNIVTADAEKLGIK